MAEIKFQGKQRSPWSWIIGIIILAGFIWFILIYIYMPNNNNGHIGGKDSTNYSNRYKAPVDTVNEVQDFIAFSRNTSIPQSSKKYTENGLIKLQSALSYVADRIDTLNGEILKKIDSLDRTIAKIDTASPNYLSEVKPAFSTAVRAMSSIQKIKFPELEDKIANLRNTENSINEKAPIKVQINKIRQFFVEAGNALQNMKLSYAYNDKNVWSGISGGSDEHR